MGDYISACETAVARLATLGGWPVWLDGRASLVSRIPSGDELAPGLDAGVACALGLIPEDKQALAAVLHAAYTEDAVEQIRRETVGEFDADSEAVWWLAACSVCEEGGVSTSAFDQQIERFREIAADPRLRVEAAHSALDKMEKDFVLVDEIPFVIRDGGLQGAYLAGYDWGVQYNDTYRLFFIGTFRSSLGLEDFVFSDRVDDQDRPMSGPVHGSKQFVKASTFAELAAAVALVRTHLG